MAAKLFGYYDNWKTELLRCPKCDWSGKFEQGSVEYFDELIDSSCPVCDGFDAPILAIVSLPTIKETEANYETLSESEKESLAQQKRILADFESRKLKSFTDLPSLEMSPIVLSWDFDEDQQGNRLTVIKQEGQIIWSEPAVYEGAERFVEVVGLLKQKYGQRLVDVVPTDASRLYLFGDHIWLIDMVEQARANLRPGGPKP